MSDAATYKTRRQGSAKPAWSDGIHFARPASSRDRHQMRWVVGAHKATASTHKRHAPTLEEAIERAKAATSFWLAAHPADRVHLTVAPADEATEAAPSESVVLQHWSSLRFDCIYANPVAQVWKCERQPGELRPVGRPKKGRDGGRGAAPTQADLAHMQGDYAVLKGDEPVRNADGSVRIFGEFDSEEFAADLYAQEPEENTISWKHGNIKVAATGRVEVHFDPDRLGTKAKPFILYLPDYSRPVYEDTTRATYTRAGVAIADVTNAQRRLDLEAARAKARAEDRQPAFEDKPLRFRSIVGAVEEAERREKMLRGETVR